MKTIKAFYLLIGTSLLFYVFSQTNFELLWGHLIESGWGIIFVLTVYGAGFVVDTVAWQFVLPSTKLNYPWLYDLWKVRMVGAAFGKMMPFSAFGGAPIKGYILKKHYNISYREGAASIILVESTHLISMIIFMAFGVSLIFLHSNLPENYRTFSIISLCALAIGIFAFFMIQRFKITSFVSERISRFALGKKLEKFLIHLKEFDERLVEFYTSERSRFFCAFGLNLLNWFLGALEIYVILYFLGHPISFGESIILETLVELIRAGTFFIPATLGSQEAGFLFATGAITGLPTLGIAAGLMRRVREIVWLLWGFVIGWQYSSSPSQLVQAAQGEEEQDV